jgi:enoyl-CoA hydratase
MSLIERSDAGDCAVLTLNRPRVRNAISNEMLAALEDHLDVVETDGSRGVIITGAGNGFCAGTDLREMTDMGLDRYLERVERVHQLFVRLRTFSLISIAAVHGAALGGGTELAAACTFRVAAADAVFGLPEIRLGVMPSYGGTQTVSRLIGENRALELMLSGRNLTATEALDIGLINRCLPEGRNLVDGACEFAGQMTPYSLVAQQGIRACGAASGDCTLEAGMALEREHTREVFASDDAREGVAAFLEKRTPRFRDC